MHATKILFLALCAIFLSFSNGFISGPANPSDAYASAQKDGAAAAAKAAGEVCIAGINVKGATNALTEPSGTLPGASPSRQGVRDIYDADGRIIPQWYDKTEIVNFSKTEFANARKQQLERASRAQAGGKAIQVGDTKDFWVKDALDPDWRQVPATVQRVGTNVAIYVDSTLTLSSSVLDLYRDEFEDMYNIVGSNIGTYSDRDGNGKVSAFIYDINDGATTSGFLCGYFWSKDYYTDREMRLRGLRSNEMDVIYMRGDPPLGWPADMDFNDYILSTLIHEYQHMVNFCVTYWQPQIDENPIYGQSDTWINEMMSMAMETLYFQKKLLDDPAYTHPSMTGNGYLKQRISYYSQDAQETIRNGQGLTYWDNNGDVLANYSLSYLMGQYLSLQASCGNAIFKNIINYMTLNGVYNYQAIEALAGQTIAGIASWEDLLKNWAAANILNAQAGLSGYLGAFSLTAHGPTSDSTGIHNGGIVYRVVDGAWSPPADAGQDVKYFELGAAAGTTTTIAGTTSAPGTTSVSETTTEPGSTTAPTTAPLPTTMPATTTAPVSLSSTTAPEPTTIPTTTVIELTTTAPIPESSTTTGPATTTAESPQTTTIQVGTTTINLSTTTTTACPATMALGPDNQNLESLRAFRDSRLGRSAFGRRIIQIYYGNSEAINAALASSPALRNMARRALESLGPGLGE